MQLARVVAQAPLRVPHGDGPHLPVDLAQHGDLAEPAAAGPVPRDVEHRLEMLSVV